MQGSQVIEGEIQSDYILPCVYEGAKLLDGIVAHVEATQFLQQIH